MSYNRRKESKFTPQRGLIGLIIFLSIWMLLSVLKDMNPAELIGSIFSNDKDPSQKHTKAELYTQVQEREATIDSLHRTIAKFQKEYKRAMIDVESESLNMRDMPSLSSAILLQIPDSSNVDILFYDKEEFVLDGKYGRWCRIKYADQEGWVWGNYLLEL